MTLFSLLVFIVIVMVVLYLVDLLPLPDARAKNIVRAIVVILALCYFLEAIGLFSGPAFRMR
jgi:hypothetical protein